MKICYHGTDEVSAKLIMKEGFRRDTWFALHLENAFTFGGLHVFSVAFDNPPDYWQFHCTVRIPVKRIVNYSVYTQSEVHENKELREQVLDSNKV